MKLDNLPNILALIGFVFAVAWALYFRPRVKAEAQEMIDQSEEKTRKEIEATNSKVSLLEAYHEKYRREIREDFRRMQTENNQRFGIIEEQLRNLTGSAARIEGRLGIKKDEF